MDNRSHIKMNENRVVSVMKKAGISGVSIALFDNDGLIDTKELGIDHKSNQYLTANSIFRAASLTKPFFSYLVLKLIVDNQHKQANLHLGKFNLPEALKEFNLDTPLWKVIPNLLERFNSEDYERVKSLTARHVLTHQTGLPINQRTESLKFLFDPGAEFGYSNIGILILQEAIEKLTNNNLQNLSQENIFVPFKMHHSHFYGYSHVFMASEEPKLENIKKGEFVMLNADGQLTAYWIENNKLVNHSFSENTAHEIMDMLPKMGEATSNIDLIKAIIEKYKADPSICAANSLHTTASDYACFITGWMTQMEQDGNEILKEAIECPKKIPYDQWAVNQDLTEVERNKTAWGMGIGLQLNKDAKVATCAFHSGDMDEWRAFFAVDLMDEKKKGIVLLSNSPAATLIYKDIILPNIDADDALNNFFKKWGFASQLETGWQRMQLERVIKIILKNEFDLVGAIKDGFIKIDNNKTLHTLTIQSDANHSLLNFAVKNEFNSFKEDNINVRYTINESQDINDNATLKIGVHHDEFYEKFIEKLKSKELFPELKCELQETPCSYKSPTFEKK